MSIYLWGCVWAVSHHLQANITITSNCIDERRTMELNHAISQPIQVHHRSHVLRCLTSTNPRSQAQFFPKFQHPNKSNNDAHQHTPIPFFRGRELQSIPMALMSRKKRHPVFSQGVFLLLLLTAELSRQSYGAARAMAWWSTQIPTLRATMCPVSIFQSSQLTSSLHSCI
jgi:hypothetical protein